MRKKRKVENGFLKERKETEREKYQKSKAAPSNSVPAACKLDMTKRGRVKS